MEYQISILPSLLFLCKRKEIRSIINLQHPGEHAACGFGLEAGGFTYIPQDFMDNDGESVEPL